MTHLEVKELTHTNPWKIPLSKILPIYIITKMCIYSLKENIPRDIIYRKSHFKTYK